MASELSGTLVGAGILLALLWFLGREVLRAAHWGDQAKSESERGGSLLLEGQKAMVRGQLEQAEQHLQEALGLLTEAEDTCAWVDATVALARISRAQGRQSEGIALLRRRLATLPPQSEEALRVRLFMELGCLMSDRGDYPITPERLLS